MAPFTKDDNNMLAHRCIQAFRRISDDSGATMVEYSIMVAMIALVSVVVVQTLGQDVFNMFDNATTVIAPISN